MANYDGDIKLSMSLDPKDVKAASRELQGDIKDIFNQSAGKELDNKFKKLEILMSKAASKAQALREKLDALEKQKIPTEEYKEIEKQINTASTALSKLQERMERFIETGGKTKSKTFKNMQYDAAQLENTIKYAQGELQELVDTGKAFTLGSDTAEYEKTVEQLADVNNEMRILTSRAEEANGGVENLGSGFSSVQKILSGFVNICGKVGNALTNVAKKLWNIASSAIKSGIQKVSNAIKNLGSSSNSADMSMKKLFWNMMKYGLGIRSLYALFRRLRSAITEGIKNLAQFNGGANQTNAAMSQLTSSLAYLQNAWAAAFAPILSFVAPVLSRLIQMIAAVINTIGKLFAALSGRTSFTAAKYKQNDYAAGLAGGGGSSKESAQEKYEKAQKKAQEKYEKQLAKTQEHNAKQIAKAEEKQAKAAKKLAEAQEEVNEQLAHYDKLNVIAQDDMKDMEMEEFLPDLWEDPELEPVNWEDFLDAGGAGDAFAEMFEEVPIDPWLQELADKIKAVIESLVAPIKKAWDQAKAYVLKSFKDMINKIWSLIKTVFKDFLEVWNQAATVEMLRTIFEIFGDIFVIIGNIAEGLEEAWKKNDTGKHILENIRDIFKILIDHVKNITESLKEWSKELNFSPIFEAFERLTSEFKKVADFVGGVLEDLFKHIVEPFFKYIIEDGGPRVVNAFSDFIDKVDWDKLRANIDKIFQAIEHLLEGAFNDLAATLEKLGPAVADFLNSEAFTTFCDNVANFITRLGDSEIIQKVFGGLAKVIGELANKLLGFLNSETFQNFINWLFDKMQAMDEEDVAGIIKGIALAIVGFKFAEFAGNGVLTAIKFFNMLSGAGAGLEIAGAALGTIAGALPTIGVALGAIADAALLLEDIKLGWLVHMQDAIPKTADDTNGFTKEVDGLAAKILETLHIMPEGKSIGDTIVVQSDYEKLEGMVSRLDLMGQEMQNSGTLSEEMAGKIDQAYDIIGDNIDHVEGMTSDQIESFGNLYKEVESYYKKVSETTEVEAAIDRMSANWEKLPESIPTEQDGQEAGKPFAKGVLEGISSIFKNDTSSKENGKYVTQGVKQGIDEGLEEDPPENWFAGIWDGFVSKYIIGSPSLLMAEGGEFLVQGLQQGIQNVWPTLMNYIKTSLTELSNKFKETWQTILQFTVTTWTNIKSELTSLFNKFKEIWQNILQNSTSSWERIKETIKTKFNSLRDSMRDTGNDMRRNLEQLIRAINNLFDSLNNKVSSVISSIKGMISSLVDSVLSAVESIKNALSSISSMVSSAASGVMSRVGSIASSIRLPHLAQGAVIPPNREFMAVLGDQKSGTNIETPLSTMVEAFNKALDARGGASSHEPIVLQLNSEVLAQAVWDEEEKRYKQRGDWEPLYT